MRIEEIHVDGFGLMHGQVVDPGPGLTVIRGQNEAGKTTLLAFIRAILFGFETGRYRALAGGRRGGWLNVVVGDGRALRVERYGESGGQGRLRVLDADGQDLGAGELPILLQGVDQRLFQNVFAFGLDELAQFARLTESEVAARIYGAGLGLGAVSALDVEGALGASIETLFKPGGQNPTMNKLLRELEDVDGRLRAADLPAEYAEALSDLHLRDAELSELHAEIESANDERRHLDRLRAAWGPWLTLCDGRSRRDAMGEVRDLSPDLPEQLATLVTRLDGSQSKAHDLAMRQAAAQSAFDTIAVDDTVIGNQGEIEEVLRAAQRDRGHAQEAQEVDNGLRRARQELDECLRRLGPGWTADRASAFDDSVSVQSEISGHFRARLDHAASELTAAAGHLVELEHEQSGTQAEVATIDAQLAEIVAGDRPIAEVGELERLLVEIELASADLERSRMRAASARQEADAATSCLQRSNAELAFALGAGRSLHDALLERNQLLALLGSVPAADAKRRPVLGSALGIAAIATGAAFLALWAGVPSVGGVLILVIGLGAVAAYWRRPSLAMWTHGGTRFGANLEDQLAAVSGLASAAAQSLGLPPDVELDRVDALLQDMTLEQVAHERATSLQEVADRSGKDVAELETTIGALAAAAGLSGPPSERDVVELREAVITARDGRSRRLGLEQQEATLLVRIDSLAGQLESARQRVVGAEANDAAAQAAWAAWLQKHDLDASFDRETAKTVIDAVTAAKRPIRSLATLTERADSLAREHKEFLAQLNSTVTALGWQRDVKGRTPAIERLIAELETALAAALEANRKRRAAVQSLDQLVRDGEDAQVSATSDEQALDALLTEHRADNVAGLRAAIQASDEARKVDVEIAECQRTLTALSGPGSACEALYAELAEVEDVATILARSDAIVARAEELDGQQNKIREEAGALRDAIAEMERDVAATADRQQREDLLAQLTVRADEWSVYALARHVLSAAREAYEAAHRPAVIEVAERYFQEWTAGRYRRILAPIGRQLEAVEHRDGTHVPLANLSTGTAQQLYLAMRFGLVEHFAATAEPLPIIMDDVLVNFDDERAALTARSIEALAEHQQVIYFTCHPEVPLTSGTQIHLERLDMVAQAAEAGQHQSPSSGVLSAK